ncbi:sec-independent translocase [Acidipropionibacterium timonense]|uniref:sec-independent translocase n=1 Tax=Acidipropionibacterium timonense TaxID=2161818 RepID=UPI001030A0D7|nr:sec-independent translocase [Acidipropionibacterium timonense]
MSSVSPTEIAVLLLLAVLMFGPEKLPEYARKAARVVYYLRNVANSTRDQLRNELGPEFADLDYRDLNPKVFVRKHLLDGMQDDIDEIREDLREVRSDLDLRSTTPSTPESPVVEETPELVAVTPFDDEAT